MDTETHDEYLNHFIAHFYKNIVKLVDRAMRKEDSSAQGQIVTEILQHLHACNNSVKVFYGREENLDHIKYYMLNYSEKPLVFYGEVPQRIHPVEEQVFLTYFIHFRVAAVKHRCWRKVHR